MSTSENKLPITSRDVTLDALVLENKAFNIPIYQRLYVWTNEQIKTLLEDLHCAYLDKEKQPKYYLGGVMVTENNDGKFDLIDGQQRFTTLWLISSILKGELSNFTEITINKLTQSRLSFSVRDFANHYFNRSNLLNTISSEEWKELSQIMEGQKFIERFIETEVINTEGFADYIYRNVYFVLTQMPRETDENKVFEAMNNRGAQLQHHEILKAKMLGALKAELQEMHRYGLLWDACSMMDDYLEKNIKIVANLTWNSLFNEIRDESERIVRLPIVIHSVLINKQNHPYKKDLLSILRDELLEKEIQKNNGDVDGKDYDAGKVRSIISFPMLLLHTLRIYQFKYLNIQDSNQSVEVKSKELIKIFDDYKEHFSNPDAVRKFIDLLWNIRELFDRHVVKWVSFGETNEEIHLIKKLYQNKTAFQRKTPQLNEGFALLQSMLYHSQQIITHYWLTPFLNKMLVQDDPKELHQYLEKLDNAMFCNAKEDLRTLSYKMMQVNDENLKGDKEYVSYTLTKSLGTSFASYWFYKLEYLLWKNREQFGGDKWKDYKMTAKNSVEHISPQNSKQEDINVVFSNNDSEELIENKKNDFGNLVLLSPGMNSEYSNKTYNAKKTDYGDKKRLDSLKSDLIFRNSQWNWELCETHRNEMIDLYLNHLS